VVIAALYGRRGSSLSTRPQHAQSAGGEKADAQTRSEKDAAAKDDTKAGRAQAKSFTNSTSTCAGHANARGFSSSESASTHAGDADAGGFSGSESASTHAGHADAGGFSSSESASTHAGNADAGGFSGS
jgi:hypothetical protein